MKDWRRVGDWGDEAGRQRGGGGESGRWKDPAGSSRSFSSKHGKPPPAPSMFSGRKIP